MTRVCKYRRDCPIPFQNPRKAKFIPIATIPTRRARKYGTPRATTSGSSTRNGNKRSAKKIRKIVQGTATNRAISNPALSPLAVSSRRPSPTRRAAIACTPADNPMMKATAIKLAKLPMPTAARDGAPRYPTIAVSTRLRTFCEAMPPMIGRARARMVRMRAEFSMRTP